MTTPERGRGQQHFRSHSLGPPASQQIPAPGRRRSTGRRVGAGLCLALACDLRCHLRHRRRSHPGAVHAAWGHAWCIWRAVAAAKGRRADPAPADAGHRAGGHGGGEQRGLVSEVAEATRRGRALGGSGDRGVCVGIAPGARRAWRRLAGGIELALQWEALAQPVTLATNDIHKGVQARRRAQDAYLRGQLYDPGHQL